MRHSLHSAVLLFSCASLAACAGNHAAEQSAKNASLSSRQEVTLRLAHAKEEAGDMAGAEKLFKQLVDQSPATPEPRAEIADFYRRHHQDQKAILNLKAALALEPNNAALARNLANTYIGAGEPGMALPLVQKAVAANPADALLYNSQGVAFDQLGEYSQAQQSYKMAYDLDPMGGTVYKINISMSYILSGKYDKAIALLRPMLDMPDAPANIRQNLALAYGMKGDSESALKLGLQDLTSGEAQENLRFYRMLAHKRPGSSRAPSAVAGEVPASVVRELFPDSQTDNAQAGADAIPVTIVPVKQESVKEPEKPVVAPAKPRDTMTSAPPQPAGGVTPDETLPEPVLKPDVQ